MPSTHPFDVTPLTSAIGAVVGGIDLTEPVGEETTAALEKALLTHHVLFFENQPLTSAQQRDLAARFGTLHVHPIYPYVEGYPELMILDTRPDNLPDADVWHADVTFLEKPPKAALLSGKLIPPLGGDTLWSSAVAAYDALSAPIRGLLDGLEAVHDFSKSFAKQRYVDAAGHERWEKARADHPPITHPVVRTHPATGRKAIFVNESFTTGIVGLTDKESDALLRFLFEHVTKPEFTVRWRWKTNDLILWDNRSTQHYAVNDYLPHRRIVHRATIDGDRPV